MTPDMVKREMREDCIRQSYITPKDRLYVTAFATIGYDACCHKDMAQNPPLSCEKSPCNLLDAAAESPYASMFILNAGAPLYLIS